MYVFIFLGCCSTSLTTMNGWWLFSLIHCHSHQTVCLLLLSLGYCQSTLNFTVLTLKFLVSMYFNKECGSIVRGESVYLTMLSGHSRHTHSVSVPNISVLLHTHVEAVLKFEVVSHFAHFWSYFSTNFHIWPTKSKLRASSTTWRCFCNVLVPVQGWKMAKKCDENCWWWHFLPFFTPLQAPKHYKNISML